MNVVRGSRRLVDASTPKRLVRGRAVLTRRTADLRVDTPWFPGRMLYPGLDAVTAFRRPVLSFGRHSGEVGRETG